MSKFCHTILFILLFSTSISQELEKKGRMAISLAEEGQLEESFRMFLEIKKGYEKKNDVSGVASALNNIGRIYYLMNNVTEARRNFIQSDSLFQILGDRSSSAEVKTNLGATFEHVNSLNWNKALHYYSAAYNIYRSLHDSLGMNRILLNMGTVYGGKGESRKALEVYKQAYSFINRNGGPLERTAIVLNIGISYYEIGYLDSALLFLHKAKKLNENLEYDTYIYRTLAETYTKLNESDSAIHYLALYSNAKDKLQNEQTNRNVTELSEKYKSQVREQEITKLKIAKKRDLLWLSIVILALVFMIIILALIFRNRKINGDHQKKIMEHRVLLAQMNPHFLFNCLSSMQRLYVEGDIEKANDLMSDFSSLIRKILEHTSKNRIRLKDELDTIKSYMEIEQIRLDHKFHFQIIIDERVDINNILVPTLITQPLVENAIWHGITPLDTEGQIRILCQLSANQKQLIITIEDNGVGFPDETSQTKHKSRGLELVEKRISTRESMSVNVREGGGTIVIITIFVEYEN